MKECSKHQFSNPPAFWEISAVSQEMVEDTGRSSLSPWTGTLALSARGEEGHAEAPHRGKEVLSDSGEYARNKMLMMDIYGSHRHKTLKQLSQNLQLYTVRNE